MPQEFTPEEKKHLAESPADSATLIGDDTNADAGGGEEAEGGAAGEQARPNADEEPPAGSQA